MTSRYAQILFTSAVQHHQNTAGSARAYQRMAHAQGPEPDRLGPDEQQFIQERDSFYMASVNTDGWPYVQHRGGPPGFLHPVDPTTLAYADYRGNRQYITNGNLDDNPRVALILTDYTTRSRLKIIGHAATQPPAAHPHLTQQLTQSSTQTETRPPVVERLVLITIEAFDWNCPQHITPRYTLAELHQALEPIRTRIDRLEHDNDVLRRALAEHGVADPTIQGMTADEAG
ncbi:pyridoxamine 5'-phosphate oxidase family protein [Streptomyces sp. NPDC053755]|uniref:pyridoxamine 5'-phosphate oxidase family protein n=1 Tax=Streptomyces sp. NPDC053755 TaxID=3155815 RepID=UPI003421B305